MDVINARPSCYTTANRNSETMWLLVYLEDTYGTEFTIISQYELVHWETIRKGVDVIVSIAGVNRQATIAYVSGKYFIYSTRSLFYHVNISQIRTTK